MITLSEGAVKKVKEFMAEQSESYSGIRVSVEPAGCSGFQYVLNRDRLRGITTGSRLQIQKSQCDRNLWLRRILPNKVTLDKVKIPNLRV